MLKFERNIFVLVKLIKFQPQDKEAQTFFKTYWIDFGAHNTEWQAKVPKLEPHEAKLCVYTNNT